MAAQSKFLPGYIYPPTQGLWKALHSQVLAQQFTPLSNTTKGPEPLATQTQLHLLKLSFPTLEENG